MKPAGQVRQRLAADVGLELEAGCADVGDVVLHKNFVPRFAVATGQEIVDLLARGKHSGLLDAL